MGLPWDNTRRSLLPETQAWEAAVRAAGSGVPSDTLRLTDRYMRDLMAYRLWDKIYMLDACVGNNFAASLVRQKVPTGVSRSYVNFNFVSADYNERGVNGGRKGDGTTKYLDTVLNPVAQAWAESSFMLWAYCRETCVAGTTRVSFGAEDAGNLKVTSMGWLSTGSGEGMRLAGTGFAGNVAATTGFLGGGNNGSRTSSFYNNGVAVGSTALGAETFSNRNLYAHASDINGTAALFNNRRITQLLMTQGLSAAEVLTLYKIVQAFETAMGRNV